MGSGTNHTRRILLRADGDSAIGLGHLYRLFALMEMFRDQFDCTFLTSERSTHEIVPSHYNLELIPESVAIDQEPRWLAKNYDPGTHIIVADGYGFHSLYQKALRDSGFRLVYVDDLSEEHMHADLVVNHAIGISEDMYSAEPYTQFALGTDHAILRPEFLHASAKGRSVDHIGKAFVCFGGADPMDHTYLVVKALLSFPEIYSIDVVLGAAYKYEEIFKAAGSNKVQIHRNLSARDLVSVLEQCHLSIVPSSTILYEVCAVKMPVITGYYVDNQRGIYDGFLSRNAVAGLGDLNLTDITSLKKSISGVLSSQHLAEYTKVQATMFDEHIKTRFLKYMEEISRG